MVTLETTRAAIALARKQVELQRTETGWAVATQRLCVTPPAPWDVLPAPDYWAARQRVADYVTERALLALGVPWVQANDFAHAMGDTGPVFERVRKALRVWGAR